MNDLVDLRSDTVTRPTEGMYDAMRRAPLGDDTYGEDPTVNALQERIAALLGFEAALFLSSGTQANLCAILAHCGRGDEYIVGQQAHCYRWEGGGAAVLGGVQPQPIENEPDGTLALARIRDAIKPDNDHFAVTRLLALENTWFGKVLPMAYLTEACRLAESRGLATHLDGARLFNAAVAQAAVHGTEPEAEALRIASAFDSVSVCFSKGLGTPVGSALCGSRAFIAKARRIRKLVGGAMRQAGVLAAAASYALDCHVTRLARDHQLALGMYEQLCTLPELEIERPDTNILLLAPRAGGADRMQQLMAHLRADGILASCQYRLRLVTHLDVTEEGTQRAVASIRGFFGSSA